MKKYIKSWKVKTKESKFYKNLFVNDPNWNKKTPNEEEKLRWELIKDFFKKIENKNRDLQILDVGSGRGWLTNLLSDYGKVKGIEPVGAVVRHARKLFPELSFVLGKLNDFVKDSEKAGNYDLIVCSEVIEHIPDDDKNKFVHNISLLLKKDGYLILTTPRKEVSNEWNKYLMPNQPVEDWLSEDEIKEILNKNSFNVIDLKRISLQPRFDAPKFEIYQLWLFRKGGK
ncbi:class I SAM-dependent methyltransferase [Salegentibacter echinorum]|uniref:class I SAM-dependent methyltransferase n=1 Tax=Salegentibacter echinorum TaxID=1073325 RepID=UPI0015871636|nr:class I SAM-dependent methyltransferase [Salegentibacter echinorum]